MPLALASLCQRPNEVLHGIGVWPQTPKQVKLALKATNEAGSPSQPERQLCLAPLSNTFKLEEFTYNSWISGFSWREKNLQQSWQCWSLSHMIQRVLVTSSFCPCPVCPYPDIPIVLTLKPSLVSPTTQGFLDSGSKSNIKLHLKPVYCIKNGKAKKCWRAIWLNKNGRRNTLLLEVRNHICPYTLPQKVIP